MLEVLTPEKVQLRSQLYEEGKNILLNAPQTYIEVDVEADGPPWWSSMLSIGAVSPLGHEFYTEMKPSSRRFHPYQRKFCIDHNLDPDRLMKEAPTRRTAMKRFHGWLQEVKNDSNDKDLVMSVGNKWFDFAWVDRYFSRAGLNNPFTGVNPIDLQSLSVLVADDWDWVQTSIYRIPRVLVPDGEFPHHALTDAKYQQFLHYTLAGLYERVKTEASNTLSLIK